MDKIIIATRKSALAMWQSEYIKNILEKTHGVEVVLQGFKTKGDVLLDSPLAKIGGKGLFTKELEESMLRGESHIAVHSLKDVPTFFPSGLKLAAITKREDVRDCFLSMKYKNLYELPQGAKVGTTSLRRQMQLLLLRKDLKLISLRGNVNSRLEKLKNEEFDAIILAKAGINRLNLEKEVNFTYAFSKDEMIPAASQGALGIESIENSELEAVLSCLNDENSFMETYIERDFIKALEGGCQVPIGINAELQGEQIKIRAVLGLPNASEILKEEQLVSKNLYKQAGFLLAQKMIQNGAKELLNRALKMI